MNGARPMTDRERRLIQFAGVGIAIYLILFVGIKFFEKKRSEYRQLTQQAHDLREHALPYKDRVALVKKLMDDFHMDPAKLKKETVVSEASAAIQKAARSGGLQLGSIRESPARGSGLTLATVQLESSGQVTAALSFLASLNSIGFPLVVDSVQFTADNTRPGQVKMNLIILILDFNQEKEQKEQKEAAHA